MVKNNFNHSHRLAFQGQGKQSQKAEQERQRADLLAERLRAMGIDPDAP
jgi:hypothetical protein